MLDIKLPDLPGGAARVVRWLVAPGATLAQGAPLAIVLTERVEAVLPAPAAGVLHEPVAVGAVVETDGVLARLGPLPTVAQQQAHPAAFEETPAVNRIWATPLARVVARIHGIDLARLAGTGQQGRVLACDVRAALARAERGSPRPASPAPRVLVAPIATATVAFDAGRALALVEAVREVYGRLRLTVGLTAQVVVAAASLLPQYEVLNGRWGGDVLVLRRRVHIAVGWPGGGGGGLVPVATRRSIDAWSDGDGDGLAEGALASGLIWALVRDAADLTVRGVARALGGQVPATPAAATFAVVSLAEGMSWQHAAPPLPGTTAALSVGAPVMQAVALGDGVAARPVGTLSLSYDARALDHGCAAAFLAALRVLLEGTGGTELL